MTDPAPVEREVKLGVWPGFRLPDLAGVAGAATVEPAPTRTLDATYYDTADLRLARRGVTLRHRRGEGDGGRWTLKLPDAGDPLARPDADGAGGAIGLARRELDLDGGPGEPPPSLTSRVAAIVRTSPLRPVARLSTVRETVVLRDDLGDVLAEVVDDEVSSFDGERLALRFREVEIELGPAGDDGVLTEVVDALRAAGAAAPDPVPKLHRVLGPRAQEPLPPLVPTLPDDPRAGDLVRFAVARSTQRLLDHDPIAREGVDPEGVHQARVATRRLRSDLRVLAPLLDEGWVAAVVGDLRWLGGALGDVRDADVLLLRLRGRLDTLDAADWPAGLGLVETLKAARADAVAALAEVMGSARYVALLDVLVAAADAPPTTDGARRRAGKALPPLVAAPVARLDRLAAAVLERGPSATDEELHRVRIAAKRARYAAEVAAPVVGRPAQRMADRLAALQGVLGDHHDACVARAWLRAAATGASAEVALVAGQLMEVERAEASRLRARWPRVWSAASRGKDRAWLT